MLLRAVALIGLGISLSAQSSPSFDAFAERIDPYVEKSRVVVMTDIANEPDDQMSMVRFLVYANQYDVEGLIASTSTWMRNKVRPDVINSVLDAYAAGAAEPEQTRPGISRGRCAQAGGRFRTAFVWDGGGRRRERSPPAPI